MLHLKTNFRDINETSWSTVLAVCLLTGLFFVLAIKLVYANHLLTPLTHKTGGLIQPLVIVSFVEMLILGGVMCWVGKLRLADLGIYPSRIGQAVSVVVLVWLVTQGIGILLSLTQGSTPSIDPWWRSHGELYIAGFIICRLCGGALKEELIFRGFLLNQLSIKIQGHFRVGSKIPLLLALLISQTLFALAHIPCMISKHLPLHAYPLYLISLFAQGVGFAFIYHRTDNLLAAVGIHSLVCTPLSLFLPQVIGRPMTLLIGVLLALLWPAPLLESV